MQSSYRTANPPVRYVGEVALREDEDFFPDADVSGEVVSCLVSLCCLLQRSKKVSFWVYLRQNRPLGARSPRSLVLPLSPRVCRNLPRCRSPGVNVQPGRDEMQGMGGLGWAPRQRWQEAPRVTARDVLRVLVGHPRHCSVPRFPCPYTEGDGFWPLAETSVLGPCCSEV